MLSADSAEIICNLSPNKDFPQKRLLNKQNSPETNTVPYFYYFDFYFKADSA
jgi:hypothetical protein